jgi:hypothetical protein
MPRHRESLEQQAFVQWCRLHPDARRIFAIPNGGKRSKIEAAIMQGEGVTPGVPDTMLPLPRGGAHGLFIEMKAPDGRETKEQRERVAELSEAGYAAVFAYGASCAIEATRVYLEGLLPPGQYRFKADQRTAL